MKLSKFLLISAVSALTLAIITLPVAAKPAIKSHLIHVQHTQPSQTALSLRSSLYDQFNGYNSLLNKGKPYKTLNPKFTSALLLNIQPMFQENNKFEAVQNSHSHNFFETTMIFNDKLQQFLSLFNHNKDANNENIQNKGCESKF